MELALETRESLLIRLRNPADHAAWRLFVDLYGPLVYRFARRRGMQDADAADLTQQVLSSFSQAVGAFVYDPQRGTFRGWLFSVMHRQYCKRQQREGRYQAKWVPVESLAEAALAPEDDERDLWERDYQRQLFLQASRMAQPQFTEKTWQAFWQTAVMGKQAENVSKDLGLSLGALYTAKSRVLDRLCNIVRELRESSDPT